MEKQKSELEGELEELRGSLEQASGASDTQRQVAKGLEQSMAKLKKELADTAEEHDKAISSLRQKHSEAIDDLEEKIASLGKANAKLDRDRKALQANEINLTSSVETLTKGKMTAEKMAKQLQEQLNETTQRVCVFVLFECVSLCSCFFYILFLVLAFSFTYHSLCLSQHVCKLSRATAILVTLIWFLDSPVHFLLLRVAAGRERPAAY